MNDENPILKIIENHCLDCLFQPMVTFINENYNRLDLTSQSNTVENVDEAELLDIQFISVEGLKRKDFDIEFSVVVDAEIEIEETVHGTIETDNINKWFTVECKANMDDFLGTFSVGQINVYLGRRR